MKSLNENYKELRCPHCGAKEFKIISDDVFLCEYCNRKFNFNLENILQDKENEVLIEELKEQFCEKITELNEKKLESKACLIYYKKKANPKKPIIIFGVIFALASFLLYSSLFMENTILTIVSAVVSAVGLTLLVIAKIHNKKMAKKYRPFVTYFAAEVAEYENEIDFYSKLVSKITR